MKLWTFWPDSPRERKRKAYVPTKDKKPANAWVCPEHQKIAMGMSREFPRDDLGRRVEGRGRELVLDHRPSILVPPRQTYPGY